MVRNGYFMTITNEQAAYIAGLFDGEGSIYFAKRPEKKKKHKGPGFRYSNSQRISMEITMTDQSVLKWVHEVLGVGTLNKKPRKGFRKDGTKYLMQWKWRGGAAGYGPGYNSGAAGGSGIVVIRYKFQ